MKFRSEEQAIRKYRGKDKQTGAWLEGGYMKHYTRTPCPINDKLAPEETIHIIIQSWFSDWNMPRELEAREVVAESVGQDTLRFDKNKKRVFEGDILTCGMMRGFGEWAEFNAIVRYDSNWGMFVLHMPDIDDDQTLDCTEIFEVIGNYTDNPELLPNYKG